MNLLPKKRADAVAYETVQNSSGLLRIHKVHVNIPGILYGFLYRISGDLVKCDPLVLLLRKLQCDRKMIGDCFSLTVRVGGKIYKICLGCSLAEILQQFSLSPDGDIVRLKIIFHIHTHITLRKIPDMSLRSDHFIVFTKIFFYRFRLGRRLNDHQILSHCLLPCLYTHETRQTIHQNISACKQKIYQYGLQSSRSLYQQEIRYGKCGHCLHHYGSTGSDHRIMSSAYGKLHFFPGRIHRILFPEDGGCRFK